MAQKKRILQDLHESQAQYGVGENITEKQLAQSAGGRNVTAKKLKSLARARAASRGLAGRIGYTGPELLMIRDEKWIHLLHEGKVWVLVKIEEGLISEDMKKAASEAERIIIEKKMQGTHFIIRPFLHDNKKTTVYRVVRSIDVLSQQRPFFIYRERAKWQFSYKRPRKGD